MLDAGRLSEGVTEVPFSFPLEASGASFLETYHGVAISVAYRLIAVCERGLMKRELTSVCSSFSFSFFFYFYHLPFVTFFFFV